MAVEVDSRVVESPAELAGRYQLVTAVPFRDRSLGYRLCLPRDVRPTLGLEPAQQLLPGEFVRTGVFEASPPQRELFEVAAARPGLDVGLADYAGQIAHRFGCKVARIQELSLRGRTIADCEGEARDKKGDLTIVRFFLYPHGPRVIRVALFAAEEDYGPRAEAFENALASFEMLEPSTDRFLEPYETHTASAGPRLAFRYPRRWAIQPARGFPPGVQALELTLVQLANKDLLRAFYRVKAVERRKGDDTAIDDLLAAALREYDRAGFVPSRPPARRDIDAPTPTFEPRALFASVRGKLRADDAELRFFALRSATAAYSIAGVVPLLENDPLGAMAGKRAIDVAALSLNRVQQWKDEIDVPPEEDAADELGGEGGDDEGEDESDEGRSGAEIDRSLLGWRRPKPPE